jgi:hypothetical protein
MSRMRWKLASLDKTFSATWLNFLQILRHALPNLLTLHLLSIFVSYP